MRFQDFDIYNKARSYINDHPVSKEISTSVYYSDDDEEIEAVDIKYLAEAGVNLYAGKKHILWQLRYVDRRHDQILMSKEFNSIDIYYEMTAESQRIVRMRLKNQRKPIAVNELSYPNDATLSIRHEPREITVKDHV